MRLEGSSTLRLLPAPPVIVDDPINRLTTEMLGMAQNMDALAAAAGIAIPRRREDNGD